MLRQNAPFSYRTDPHVPAFDDSHVIAIMDATCGLCAKGARWIARNDRDTKFRIVPINAALGKALARHYGVDPDDPLTWLVVDAGRAYAGLDATMHTGRLLGGVWKGLDAMRVVPRPIRDWTYRLVARNRYRFFGRTDLCAMPDPDVQKRLLT